MPGEALALSVSRWVPAGGDVGAVRQGGWGPRGWEVLHLRCPSSMWPAGLQGGGVQVRPGVLPAPGLRCGSVTFTKAQHLSAERSRHRLLRDFPLL